MVELNVGQYPTNLLTNRGRSAIELARRMLLVRWSTGKYLTALGGNHGVGRPPIGFGQDDFYRAVVQALGAQEKNVMRAFHKLLEICLGPSETLVFSLSVDAASGDSFIELDGEMLYSTYSATAGTPFTLGEELDNGSGSKATFRYLDTNSGRIFYTDETGAAFVSGDTLTGATSGATATLSSGMLRQVIDTERPVTDRLPLYGSGTLSPSLASTEAVELGSVDYYLKRIRLRADLTNGHTAGNVFVMEKGSWEFIQARTRKVVIKVNAFPETGYGLPSSTYLHPLPQVTARARVKAGVGTTSLQLDETAVQQFPATPFKILVDPKSRRGEAGLMEVSAVNTTTRTLTVPALARAVVEGTEIRWWHTLSVTGGLTSAITAGDTTITTQNLREEDVVGVWVLDEAGVGNGAEYCLVTSTTYQRRRVTARIVSGVAGQNLYVHHPFKTKNLPASPVFRVFDETGLLGTLTAATGTDLTGLRQIPLSGSPSFTVEPVNGKLVYVELCDNAAGQVTLTVGKALVNNHVITTTFHRFYGLSSLTATYSNRQPQGTWPQGATPDGTWVGGYLFDQTQRSPSLLKASTSATVEAQGFVAQDATDCRTYLASEEIAEDYSTSTATSTMGIQTVTTGTVTESFQTYDVWVEDVRAFPTTAQITAWRSDTRNPNAGYPIQLKVAGEGGFGRSPVYLWGKTTTDTDSYPAKQKGRLHVSGLVRTHEAGVEVKTYHTEVPIEAGAVSTLATADGFPATEAVVIMDYGSSRAEQVNYNSLALETPVKGKMQFTRGWTPDFSHFPLLTSNLDSTITKGTPVLRAGTTADSKPLKNGYSFSFIVSGNGLILRLAWLLERVRAAGIEVTLVDAQDKKINFPLPF